MLGEPSLSLSLSPLLLFSCFYFSSRRVRRCATPSTKLQRALASYRRRLCTDTHPTRIAVHVLGPTPHMRPILARV